MGFVENVISIAQGEVGTHEGYENGHWNNIQKYSEELPGYQWSDGQAWCDVFVNWVFWKAGIQAMLPLGAESASCGTSLQAYKNAGQYSDYPGIGAQVFFGHDGGSHTGIVIGFDADTITTVEGNTNTNGSPEGDGVYQKTHQRRDAWVYGYGYPAYPGGIVSADPVRGGTTAVASPDPAPAPAPEPAPAPAPDGLPDPSIFRIGNSDPAITTLGEKLVAAGFGSHYTSGPGPVFSEADRENVADFQRSRGWSGSDADGYPGPETIQLLWNGVPPAPAPAPAPQPQGVTVSLSRILQAQQIDVPAYTGHQTFPADVQAVEGALHAAGLLDAAWVDGSWGTFTNQAYAAWQRQCGYSGRDADGVPGMASLTKLGAAYGFGVTN